MNGYGYVSLDKIQKVVDFHAKYGERLDPTLRRVVAAAEQHYTDKHVGKRYWTCWFKLIPVSKERAQKWAVDKFSGGWYPLEKAVSYLNLPEGWQQGYLNIDFLCNRFRNDIHLYQSLVNQSEEDELVLLHPTDIRHLDNILGDIEDIAVLSILNTH